MRRWQGSTVHKSSFPGLLEKLVLLNCMLVTWAFWRALQALLMPMTCRCLGAGAGLHTAGRHFRMKQIVRCADLASISACLEKYGGGISRLRVTLHFPPGAAYHPPQNNMGAIVQQENAVANRRLICSLLMRQLSELSWRVSGEHPLYDDHEVYQQISLRCQHLSALTLSLHHLKPDVLLPLSKLTTLKRLTLHLHRYHAPHSISDILLQLPNLAHLELATTQPTFTPAALSRLHSLISLTCTCSQDLQVLPLPHGGGVCEAGWAHLGRLLELECPLRDQDLPQICRVLTQLESLTVHTHNLHNADCLTNLSMLTALDLEGEDISCPNNICTLKQLRDLRLMGSFANYPDGLSSLAQLSRLEMIGCFQRVDESILALTALVDLRIGNYDRLGDEDYADDDRDPGPMDLRALQDLAAFKLLKALHISGCSFLLDASALGWHNHSSLTSLCLYDSHAADSSSLAYCLALAACCGGGTTQLTIEIEDDSFSESFRSAQTTQEAGRVVRFFHAPESLDSSSDKMCRSYMAMSAFL